MTIYQQYGNSPFDPASTPRTADGVYDLTDKAEYGFEWCFDDFWSEDGRENPGYYRIAANTRVNGRWGASKEHVQSLVTYAKWITDVFHMPCYIVRNPCDLDELYRDDREHHGEHGGRLKDPEYKDKVVHDEHHMYGIEVRYDSTYKADQFFTAVCYARFACYEYTQFAPELNGFTPATLLRDIFAPGFILKLLHMPFIDFYGLFDDFGQDKNKPQINAEFGRALHDFAEGVLKSRVWRSALATDSDARHNSYINVSEFHKFYATWRLANEGGSTESAIADHTGLKAVKPEPAPDNDGPPARVFPEAVVRKTYVIPRMRPIKIRFIDEE